VLPSAEIESFSSDDHVVVIVERDLVDAIPANGGVPCCPSAATSQRPGSRSWVIGNAVKVGLRVVNTPNIESVVGIERHTAVPESLISPEHISGV
jgi:hypothetical protein